MNPDNPVVYIIDDDAPIRRSISLLLSANGYHTESFAGVEEFHDAEPEPGPGCILLDIFLEGSSGLDRQDEITENYCHLPIIYMTGRGDVPMSVRALKKGAVNFLQKPIEEKQLLEAIGEALLISREKIRYQLKTGHSRSLLDKLTHRELEIFHLVIRGMLNKQIAAELSISEHTVKIHRGRITEKLGVKSVAEMIHIHETSNPERSIN